MALTFGYSDTTTWYANQTNTAAHIIRVIAAPLWRNLRERDRLFLARAGAWAAHASADRPRRYLTTRAQASVGVVAPLRGGREFAYKRPRKGGIIPGAR